MFKKVVLSAVFVCAATTAFSQTPVACSNISVGSNGALNGFVPSPSDAWHQDITNAPIDPNSVKITTTSGDLLGAHLHPDFSSIAAGGFGIPYTVVDSTQTPSIAVPIILYGSESDITLVPMPSTVPVEGNPSECPATNSGDHHVLVLDRNKCVMYELWQAAHCNSAWSASDMAVWDFSESEKRPYGYTSADAAGLSVFEGLIRYDEIVAGVINHAIRFTAAKTRSDAHIGYFTAPATHAAGNLSISDNIMGMRIRLKPDFDISGFSSTNQIILKAMKRYGMILADNGSNLFFQGTPDSRWNDNDLNALKVIPSTAFDVVQMGPVYESNTTPSGAVPVINSFTASATTVASGTAVTLTPTVTGASYNYIDNAGFSRGPVTVTPTATTTYTLTSRNAFGTASASVKVTVSAGATKPNLVFATIAGKTFGAAPFAASATSNSTGAITYTVVSGPATMSGSTVTLTGVGTATLQASQAAAGNYTSTTTQTSFVISPGSPTLAFVSVPSKTFGTAAFVVSTTTNSSGSIAYSVVSGPATISGNTVTLTGAGSVTLQANEAAAGNYTAGVAQTTFTVNPGTPTLTFAAIASQSFGAAPFAVSASSPSSGGIVYSVISGPATINGSTVTLTGSGTVTLQAKQSAAGNYTAATATTAFSVTAGTTPSKLAFVAIWSETFGTAPFTLSATSASPGAITYSIASGPATISGNTVTLTGGGTLVVQATQAASGNYASATTTMSIPVKAGVSGLAFVAVPATAYGTATFPITATTKSSGAIVYSVTSGPATVSGNMVTLTGIGAVNLQATQAATTNYVAATVSTHFTVTPQTATINFPSVPDQTFGVAPITLNATSNSPAPITYSLVAGWAVLSGNTVTLSQPGVLTIRARQAAVGNFAAGSAQISFNVAAEPVTLTFSPIAAQVYGTSAPFKVTATSASAATVVYSVASGPATVSGNSVTLTGAGTVTLQATQAASRSYAAGTATTSFNVTAQ